MNHKQELQILLDISYKHVITQGYQSLSSNGSCAYVGPEGQRCAAGPFVLEYTDAMEDVGFESIAEEFSGRIHPLAVKHADFVEKLQEAHDDYKDEVNLDEGGIQDTGFLMHYNNKILDILNEYDLRAPNV